MEENFVTVCRNEGPTVRGQHNRLSPIKTIFFNFTRFVTTLIVTVCPNEGPTVRGQHNRLSPIKTIFFQFYSLRYNTNGKGDNSR